MPIHVLVEGPEAQRVLIHAFNRVLIHGGSCSEGTRKVLLISIHGGFEVPSMLESRGSRYKEDPC